jgi:carbonic anhydrase
MSVCTVINCVDGRVQLPVIGYLQQRFSVDTVDCITETAPARIFDKVADLTVLNSIFNRLNYSLQHHDSRSIAICAHAGCDGNTADAATQQRQLRRAVIFLKESYRDKDVIGLWVDDNLDVSEIAS